MRQRKRHAESFRESRRIVDAGLLEVYDPLKGCARVRRARHIEVSVMTSSRSRRPLITAAVALAIVALPAPALARTASHHGGGG